MNQSAPAEFSLAVTTCALFSVWFQVGALSVCPAEGFWKIFTLFLVPEQKYTKTCGRPRCAGRLV